MNATAEAGVSAPRVTIKNLDFYGDEQGLESLGLARAFQKSWSIADAGKSSRWVKMEIRYWMRYHALTSVKRVRKVLLQQAAERARIDALIAGVAA